MNAHSSFVVQGDMIGVFKQQTDGGKKVRVDLQVDVDADEGLTRGFSPTQLKFVTSIVNLSTPDGKKGFVPQKVMLHNQGTSAHGSYRGSSSLTLGASRRRYVHDLA